MWAAECLLGICLLLGYTWGSEQTAFRPGKTYQYAAHGKVPPGSFDADKSGSKMEMNYFLNVAVTGPNTFAMSDGKMAQFRECIELVGRLPTDCLVDKSSNVTHYDILNRQWNLRKPKVFPVAYFLPTSTAEVQRAVTCGVQSSIRLIPSSGGHSYEAISVGDGSQIVIDFRNMRKIRLNQSQRRFGGATASIQPGALVGHINAYLYENGGYGMPLGNCMTVGIGGHATGGGIGYYGALYGLAMDSVVEVELVDAAGRAVRASPTENPDLWWALRGAGPGYIGLVTSYKVKVIKASNLQHTLVKIMYPTSHFAEVWNAFENLLNWTAEHAPHIFVVMYVTHDYYNATTPPLDGGIQVQAIHIRDPVSQPEGNATFLAKMTALFPPGGVLTQEFPSHLKFLLMTGYGPVYMNLPETRELVEVGKMDAPALHGQPGPASLKGNFPIPDLTNDQIIAFLKRMNKEDAIPRHFKARSFFVEKFFPAAQMAQMGEVIRRIPKNNLWIMINTETGKIHEAGPGDSAYVHRRQKLGFSVHYEGSAEPEVVEKGMAWMDEYWKTVQFMDSGESYQNYPDLDVKDHLQRYYGQNLDRLKQSKRKWDPKNYFQSPLSLPLA